MKTIFVLVVAAGVIGVVVLRSEEWPGWVQMWVLAVGIFFGAKASTVVRLFGAGARPEMGRLLAYVFLWPGLNAHAFCVGRAEAMPTAGEWAVALVRVVLGVGLLAAAARFVEVNWFLAGWMGMVGSVLVLHFGMFHLVALAWRRCGVDARPLMERPGSATSVSKLWSGRWNTAFTELMHREVFGPIARRFGMAAGLVGVFGISGLLHELVISVPARGGYGLPSLYFGLQCAGVLVERSGVGARIGLGRGLVGWIFVALVAGAPALMLFPPVFVENVIAPMLRALKGFDL
jgi:alginate O-acetyltransferase complex protein AlgI